MMSTLGPEKLYSAKIAAVLCFNGDMTALNKALENDLDCTLVTAGTRHHRKFTREQLIWACAFHAMTSGAPPRKVARYIREASERLRSTGKMPKFLLFPENSAVDDIDELASRNFVYSGILNLGAIVDHVDRELSQLSLVECYI